jgi:RimJ/RimL family protein N-acetyltransferase
MAGEIDIDHITNHSIETPRLILRPPCAADFPRWADMHGDPVTMEHLGGVQAPSDAWRGLAMIIGAWSLGEAAMFSVIEKSSLKWIGRIGPWVPHQWPVREVGWGVHRDAQGTGMAFEAAVYSVDFAFETLGWDRVDHLIADENTRSQALAKRLGSAPGGIEQMPGALAALPVRAWGQTRAAWQARRQSLLAHSTGSV